MIAAGVLMTFAAGVLMGAGARFFNRVVPRCAMIAARLLASVKPDYGYATISGNHRCESALGLSSIPMRDNCFAPRPAAIARDGQIHVVRVHTRPALRQPIRRERAVRQRQDGGIKSVLALRDRTRR
jgi:hypothetical protein